MGQEIAIISGGGGMAGVKCTHRITITVTFKASTPSPAQIPTITAPRAPQCVDVPYTSPSPVKRNSRAAERACGGARPRAANVWRKWWWHLPPRVWRGCCILVHKIWCVSTHALYLDMGLSYMAKPVFDSESRLDFEGNVWPKTDFFPTLVCVTPPSSSR